ncbi:MAG: M48 family metallopeptidase [Alphaproteobacteria bacterium]|nr:M48 family metallopeptidase [Alphaproteobacteria bacterium]
MADSEYIFSTAHGEEIRVIISTRRGLRNITLRPKTRPIREIHISKPWLVCDRVALDFLESKRRWIERAFERAPAKEVVAPGINIEILGRRVTVVHDGARHSNGYSDDGRTLVIGGTSDMFERRLRDFIKKEFLTEVKRMVRTAPRELWPSRIAVRDTTSRWGSCSSTGTMSFSWRLAFAPPDVMRYVVMHEVAHRVHMDHSPAFWATVGELYGFGVERAKRWLNAHGAELHKYL